MRQISFLSCLFVVLLLDAHNAETAEPSPWNIHGTVRDAEGKPMKDVWVSYGDGFSGLHGSVSKSFGYVNAVQTDADGNYDMPIIPIVAFSKMEPNKESGRPPVAVAFRFQQINVQPHRYLTMDNINVIEKSRSTTGDLIIIGDYATPEDIAELKKRFAEEKYDIVFIEKDSPCQIDFVVEPLPQSQFDIWQFLREEKPLPEDYIPSSWNYRPNYWVGRAESDRQYEICRKLVLPLSMNTVYKEALELTDKVSASLRFPKSEIMVGEPIYFEYVVRNDSDTDLWIEVGGDYRNSTGRPDSFTMQAVRNDGDKEKTVYEIPNGGNMGGISSGKQIAANGGEYVFELFLPHWLILKEPGEYRIDAARHLQPLLENSFILGRSLERIISTPYTIYVASGTLTVKPFDHDAFGKLIDDWGERATVAVPEDIDYRERDKMFGERTKARTHLANIDDKRTIPWLIETDQFRALAKFDDDAALAAIAKDIDSPDDTKSHSAAANLSRSKHPEAINILLRHHNHPNYRVRLTAVQAARRMDRETALAMLREHFDDPGWEGRVGKEAQRIYKELTGEDAE